MAVAIVGTLDTKGTEVAYLRDLLQDAGVGTVVIDAGSLGSPVMDADVTREQVFTAAGTSLKSVQQTADRGQAVTLAAAGAAKIVKRLHEEGRIQGVLSLGGSAGTTIGTATMRVLPYGVPKVMVSTLASGQVQHYVGVRDICMIHSVTDICGLNRFTRKILANAVAAIVGMIHAKPIAINEDKPLIAATMFGVTTPCVEAARKHIEESGFEVLVFHATGTGGRTMEAMIADGLIAGVLDITTTELADELVGGTLSAGRDRLTAAAIRGIPQVISLGALDMVNFGPVDSVPKKFDGRRFYQHNARGPTMILMPLQGVSAIDREDGPFWWPEADAALFQSIRNWVGPSVKLLEVDRHINDPAVAQIAAETLLAMIRLIPH